MGEQLAELRANRLTHCVTWHKFGKGVFSVSSPSHWNSLPETVCIATDPKSFKKNLGPVFPQINLNSISKWELISH